jgi:hypothetical protein
MIRWMRDRFGIGRSFERQQRTGSISIAVATGWSGWLILFCVVVGLGLAVVFAWCGWQQQQAVSWL